MLILNWWRWLKRSPWSNKLDTHDEEEEEDIVHYPVYPYYDTDDDGTVVRSEIDMGGC